MHANTCATSRRRWKINPVSFSFWFLVTHAALLGFPLATDSAKVLLHGEWEIETVAEYAREAGNRATAIAPAVVFGVGSKLQIECASEVALDRDQDGHQTRRAQPALLARLALVQPVERGVSVAAEAELSRAVPLQSHSTGEYGTYAGLTLLATVPSRSVETDVNVGYSRHVREASDDMLFAGLAVRRPWMPGRELLAETYTEFSPRGGGGAAVVIAVGFTWALPRGGTMGVRLGTGLNRHGPDLVGTFGLGGAGHAPPQKIAKSRPAARIAATKDFP